jgi:hypothetical protein
MVLTFTLQSAYSGATYVAGPFDISGTTSGGVTTLLGDNISKASLLAGVTISNIDDATTGGTIQSVDGICSNSIQWTVTGGPGPTVTPTPTPSGNGFCFELTMNEFDYQSSELSVRYTPVGGTLTLTALQGLEVNAEAGGEVTIFLCSETTPTWWNSTNNQVVPPMDFTDLGTNCTTNGDCVNGGGQTTPTPTPGEPTPTPVPTNTTYFCQQTVNDPCGIYQQPCFELGLIDCTLPE